MKRDMTVGKEWKHILLFSLPIMAGNLLQQLYNTADSIIVGQFVNEDAFSGVVTNAPLTYFFVSFAIGLSIGAGVVIAQYFGAGKHDDLPVSIDSALILLGACGLILTLIAFFFAPILLRYILSVPEDVMPFALTYFRIYALGLFFQFIYNSIAATLRGLGDSKAVLLFLVVATILNIVLDLLFVAVFKWSVMGAAIATVIAQVACAVVSYLYLRKRFPFSRSADHWNRKTAITMTKLGLPVAIQQCLVSVGQGSMQRLVNSFGSAVPGLIAAYGAGYRLDYFIFAPSQGFQSGMASFSGQNMGAGKLDRVKRGLLMTLAMSLSLCVAMSILLYVFAGPIMTIFGLTGDAYTIGIEQIRFLSMFFWVFTSYVCFAGLLQGAGDTMVLSATTLSGIALRIAAGYSLVYFGILGYSAAWTTYPITWAFSLIVLGTRFFIGKWKKKAVAGVLAK